jgi:hypothetical protein
MGVTLWRIFTGGPMSNELVTIAKQGEGELQILESTLEQHIQLGWKKVEPTEPAKKATGNKKNADAE